MIKCNLCPHYCQISPGESGFCNIRINDGKKLVALTFAHPVAIHLDPIEKKPLFHFLPGSSILSIATVGCNLRCKNCQNWEISQAHPENIDAYNLPPDQLVEASIQANSPSIAYTYTDPVAYYEYTLACAKEAKKKNIKNVLVTAAYINQKPWQKLLQYVDAANVDLKSMSDSFYQNICSGTLKPVLNALIELKKANVHTEITNLLIPTLNDSDHDLKTLILWIKDNMGPETPLHFSRFFPKHLMQNLPPTPSETLIRARNLALSLGLHYVYIGNIHGMQGESTYCPQCGDLIIERIGYKIIKNKLDASGRHPNCDYKISGVWNAEPL